MCSAGMSWQLLLTSTLQPDSDCFGNVSEGRFPAQATVPPSHTGTQHRRPTKRRCYRSGRLRRPEPGETALQYGDAARNIARSAGEGNRVDSECRHPSFGQQVNEGGSIFSTNTSVARSNWRRISSFCCSGESRSRESGATFRLSRTLSQGTGASLAAAIQGENSRRLLSCAGMRFPEQVPLKPDCTHWKIAIFYGRP